MVAVILLVELLMSLTIFGFMMVQVLGELLQMMVNLVLSVSQT